MCVLCFGQQLKRLLKGAGRVIADALGPELALSMVTLEVVANSECSPCHTSRSLGKLTHFPWLLSHGGREVWGLGRGQTSDSLERKRKKVASGRAE